MRAFFQRAAYRIQRFMQGRYGQDEFSRFLTASAFVLLILSLFVRPRWILTAIVWIILIYSVFRMLSKNIEARTKERTVYLNARNKLVRKWNYLKNRLKDRKEYNYYSCPGCKAHVRIRKPGKGKTIIVTCPKCHEQFQKKT